MSTQPKSIIVTGHPYAYPHYFKVFEYVDRAKYIFVLPRVWHARTTIYLQSREGYTHYGLTAWSYGRQSLLGGLFKGWLPAVTFLIPYLRITHNTRILYSCSEPNLLTTLWNSVIAKLCGLKVILFTWQNVPSKDRLRGLKRFISDALVRLNLFLVDGIICGNEKAVEIIRAIRPQMRILHAPLSGVDIKQFKPAHRSSMEANQSLTSQKLVLFYGALDERKGLLTLLQSWAQIADPAARLWILGRGPLRSYLESQAHRLRISETVTFQDWLPNDQLPDLLRQTSIFVYPSVPRGGWEEQFGYAMAEASACGVPVIATDTGSISEVVIDGQTGILVAPNDSSALVSALGALLTDDGLLRRLGHAGRRHIEENFSHEIIANKIDKFLSMFV